MPQILSDELAIYTQAIPAEVHRDVHRWDEAPWLLRWHAPLTTEAAHFWFLAATMPERLLDTSRLKRTPKLLKHQTRPEDLLFEVAVRRLALWQASFTKHYKSDRFFTQIPVVQLLRHFFDLSMSFEIVREAFDKKWWAAALTFLGTPESVSDRETLYQWTLLQTFDQADRLLNVQLISVVGTSTDALHLLLKDFDSKRTLGPTSIALAEVLNASDWLKWAKTVAPPLDGTWFKQVFRKLGDDAAPYLTSRILAAKRRMDVMPIIDALVALEDSRTVGPLLALYDRPESSRAAEKILDLKQAWVLEGLEASKVNRGKVGKLAEKLDSQHKNRKTSANRLPVLAANEYPAWLRTFARPEKPVGLPQYASLKGLPVLHTSSHEATAGKDVVYGFLAGLQELSADSKPDWSQSVEDLFEFESLREFIWTLFHEFSRHGLKPDHFWIIHAVGIFGDDELVFRVAPYADDWAIAGNYAAAELLVSAIARIKTEASLTKLSHFATSARAKFVRSTAQNLLASFAAKRGLSPEDLEDRSIDDAGLYDGQTFDYGARAFTLGLSPDFKTVAIDNQGIRTPGLPRARKTDDAQMVLLAKNEFALTRKRVAQVVTTQKTRMEHAMVHGRRWNIDPWQRTFISHPIMRLLATRLVWAAFDLDGKVRFTFRVTDELTPSSLYDTDVALPDNVHIGVVHPLEIPPESRLVWQERFAEYEVIPPFEQMTRPVFSEPEDLRVVFKPHAIESGWLRGHFAKRGWQIHYRDGVITDYVKTFPNAGLRASIRIYPGIQFSGGPQKKQIIKHLFLELDDSRMADPVSISEALLDVHGIVDRKLTA